MLLNSPFLKSMISKFIERLIRKKTGLNVDIDIKDWEISDLDPENVVIHINAYAVTGKQSITDFIFKKGEKG